MTRVLITGGAGFIGSNIADALLARGDDVVVVDDLSSGKRDNVPSAATFIEGDLADDGLAARAVAGCTKVVHCAARPSVAASIGDPLGATRANLEATLRLVVAARDAGVARIVYSSTSAAYGDDVEGSATEDLREAPVSPYGMSKLAAEHVLRMAPRIYGLDTLCLRYFNVYGPRQDASSPYSGVISLFITAALEEASPVIYGDGQQSRDFTYVSDVVAANLLALDTERGGGRVVNIGGGQSTSLLELWDTIRRACGVPDLDVCHEPARTGDIRHSCADASAARDLLGFGTRVSLAQGLEDTVAWYRAHLLDAP